ncbi:hypothetical protein GJ654_09935 [Rhodoblastus acidophilus]|uniref:Major tropism determinant N-terminal domain-containing protein n=1 Tax=Rhodoblastus acidophilus TaxID=1074 RepID=A0A6N8DL55_RHOAC|nr:hypothetical protein [Rhodoblastus acidophilus]MCW2275039.1 hypothetical protein [Rhodoblastus acidophilus]MTV31312.1 hypothetical protein [Rhodoblastus acidophilus]
MSVQLKRRRDTAANVAAFTGAQGELIVDTTNNRLTVHDGATPGGWPVAKLSEVILAARSTVTDVNYTILTTDRMIGVSALTAARTLTLPSAASFPTGVTLGIFDESGAASSTITATIAASGSDRIDGAASIAINSPYGFVLLQSNGGTKWTLVSRAASSLPAIGVGTPADATNPLSVYGASALFNGTSFNLTINKSAVANTASILFQDGFSGRAQIGLAGDDNLHIKVSANGSTWTEAFVVNAATGQPTFPQGIAAGAPAGFRNRLRNASFAINQRAVSGTVTLAAGAYGHDGVKAGASGGTYTFSTSGLDTTITVTSGSLILPVEASLVEGGAYALSHAGTAQARVWQGAGYSGSGSYASAPFVSTGLNAASQTNVEFSTGTILRPQFEPGTVVTLFERRPISVEMAMCQRYFVSSYLSGTAPGTASQDASAIVLANGPTSDAASNASINIAFPAPMRAAPSVTLYNAHTGATASVYLQNAASSVAANVVTINQLNASITLGGVSFQAHDVAKMHFTAAAEI